MMQDGARGGAVAARIAACGGWAGRGGEGPRRPCALENSEDCNNAAKAGLGGP